MLDEDFSTPDELTLRSRREPVELAENTTRTRSSAVTRSQPTRHESQCAHDIAPGTCR